MHDYWRLPGPAAFLGDVIDAIESGRNALLLMPRLEPPGVLDRVRDMLRAHWSVRTITASEQQSPLQAVFEHVFGQIPSDAALSPAGLAADERVVGNLVLVDGVDTRNWEAWRQFMREYEFGCRRRPADRRMLVIVVAKGLPAESGVQPEVALAELRWDGYVSEFDMLVYAVMKLRGLSLPPRKRQLLALALARIAVWDSAVIDEFCDAEPERVLEPLQTLSLIGTRRGWESLTQPSWENGALQTIDGMQQIHSAYMAFHDTDFVMRRVWSAQASVLLPIIEEKRTALLPKVRRYVRMPLETYAGTIHRIEDLEVGHMLWRLNAEGAERSLIRTVDRLKRARDALAHLEPLPLELALHPELLS